MDSLLPPVRSSTGNVPGRLGWLTVGLCRGAGTGGVTRDLSDTGHRIIVGIFRDGEQMDKTIVWTSRGTCGVTTGPKSVNHVVLENSLGGTENLEKWEVTELSDRDLDGCA